jgi:type IV pilus biogenesis protein CpaD/CtpE
VNYVSKQVPVPSKDVTFNESLSLILLVIVTILIVCCIRDRNQGRTIVIQLQRADQVNVTNVGSQVDVVVSSTSGTIYFRFGPETGNSLTLRFNQDQLSIKGNCLNVNVVPIDSSSKTTSFLLGLRRLDEMFGCKWHGSISAISWRVTIFKFPAQRLLQSN